MCFVCFFFRTNSPWRHSPNLAIFKSPNIRRWSHLAHLEIQDACVPLYMYSYIQAGPVEIQAPAHLSLIGCSVTILWPALSPSSNHPFIHKNVGLLLKNITISMLFSVFKLPNLTFRVLRCVCIYLWRISRLVFMMGMRCVYCRVRTENLCSV